MNMWKRAISLLLATVLVVQMFPAAAIAAEMDALTQTPAEPSTQVETYNQEATAVIVHGETEPPTTLPKTENQQPPAVIAAVVPQSSTVAEDFSWTLEDGVLTVTGHGDMPNWNYGNAPWHSEMANITQVRIEEGITSIGSYAFYAEYTPITSVTMADTVTSIGDYAFDYCRSMTELHLSENLTTMGRAAFANCESLETVVLPDGLTEIPDGAFSGCSALKSVTLPQQLTRLGGSVFEKTALAEITLPETVTYIGSRAFYNCTDLAGIEIPAGVREIGGHAFYGCTALSGIRLPDGITTINDSTFYGCTALVQIDLPSTLKQIWDKAFYECAALTDIDLPEGLILIGSKAFAFCTGITAVEIPSTMTFEEYTDSDAFWKSGVQRAVFREGIKSIGGFYGCTALTEAVIPDGVEVIEEYAFHACANLTGVDIPTSVTEIKWNAFNGCTALTEVTLPENLTFLDQGAFAGCTGLTAVELPDSLTRIGWSAFSQCTSLETVTLPTILEAMEGHAFSGCTSLKQIYIPDTVTAIGAYAFQGCSSLEQLRMSSQVMSIGEYCFSNSGITSIELPDGLTTIGKKAFNSCAGLREVSFPDTLTAIGEEAFYKCTALESVELPSSVQTVGLNAFCECTALAELVLNEGVQNLGNSAFAKCTALKSVTIPASLSNYSYGFCNSGLESVTIAEGQTQIGSHAFFGCTSLTEVSMADTVTTIGSSAFGSCSELPQIRWPANLATVGSEAFQYCSGLERVEIPAGVTMGDGVFSGCAGLMEVTFPQGTCSIGREMFSNCRGLLNVEFGNGLTSIGSQAFNNCIGLKSVVIPDTVECIDSYAFQNCSELIRMEIPENVTTIGSNAFRGCSQLTIFTYSTSYAWQYAVENNIPVVNLLNSAALTLKVTDETGAELTGGFTVLWYASDSEEVLATGQTLSGINADAIAYDYLVVLDEDMSSRYWQPQRTSVEIRDNQFTLICTLKPIAQIMVTGLVSASDDMPLSGAEIHFTQTFGEQYTRETSVSVNADGSFTVPLRAVPTQAEITAPGYFSCTVPLGLEAADQTYVLNTVVLNPLPSNKITLSLLRVMGAAAGDTALTEPITDIQGLQFSVRNMSRNTEITDFALQLPYLILGAGQAAAGETVQITVSAQNGELETSVASVVLDENQMGQAEVRLVSNGGITVNALLGCEEAVLMVFDAAGKLVLAEGVRAGYVSRELHSGSYRLVFLQKNDLLRSVAEIAMLDELGLRAGTDYALKTVNVQRGVLSAVPSVTVPALDESRLCYTLPEKTDYAASDYSLYPGEYTLIRLSYELEPGHNARNQKLQLEIPRGVQILEGSVSLNSKTCTYVLNNGIMEVNAGADRGILRFYCSFTEVGELESTAYLVFEEKGSVIRQPLGTRKFTVCPGTLEVADEVGSLSVPVRGVTVPDATVSVYDNGILVATTTANGVGSWYTKINLVESYVYSFHEIYADIEIKDLQQTYRTETVYTRYDQGIVELSNVTMYNTADSGLSVSVFNFNNPQVIPAYRCWPSRYPKFTFHVNFRGNSRNGVRNVYVVTKDAEGDTRYIPCTYDEKAETWLGVAHFNKAKDVPVEVGTVFDRVEPNTDDTKTVIDQNRIDDMEAAVQEAEAQIDAELASVELSDESKYDGYTIEELDAEIDALDAQMDQILAEVDYAYDTCLQELNVSTAETDKGITADFAHLNAHVTMETDITVDEKVLLASGYEKIPTSSGGYIFRAEDEGSVSIIDPVQKTRLEMDPREVVAQVSQRNFGCEEFPMLMADSGGALENLKSAINVARNLLENIGNAVDEFTDVLSQAEQRIMKKEKDLLQRSWDRSIALKKKAAELKYLEEVGIDEEILTIHKNRYARDLQRAQDLAKKIEQQRALLKGIAGFRTLLKRLPILGLVMDLIQFYDYGVLLAQLAENLPAKCPGDQAKLDQIRRDIDGLIKFMAFHVASSMTMNIASLTGLFAGGIALTPVTGSASFWAAAAIAATTITATLAADWAAAKHVELTYQNLQARIATLQCDEKPPMQPNNPRFYQEAKPILDPSGYVYEAVPSNRLEGVKAEIYERVGEEAVLWNARDYEQENPVYTDGVGYYRWDVPFGQWLVRFSKEGYNDTDSSGDPAANADGYLPVPPPQMDVNTAMVSTAAPVVESVNVYQDQIQILFSQYMQPETVNSETVQVYHNGKQVSGTISAANLEDNYDGTDSYASVFLFTPERTLAANATVIVRDAVNYADKPMTEACNVTKKVTVRPERITVADTLEIAYGEQKTLQLQILPAQAGAGRSLSVSSFVPEIAGVVKQTVTADADGKAVVTLVGNMPGDSAITVKLEGSDLQASCDVQVVIRQDQTACEKVEASIPSGSVVAAGTKLTLRTPTQGAEIYYTLDGTCPCVVDSASRLHYTGPITIREDMFLIAYAVKDGFADSPTAAFVYTVQTECGHSFGPWEETKAPTGTAAGEETKTCTLCGHSESRPIPPLNNPFDDVKSGDYFYDPVLWAVNRKITNGISETIFGPDQSCTRAQAVTFLYRAAGEPAYETKGNPFTDVQQDTYYYDAVMWAVENGITNGTSDTTFSPDATCTRGQIVTFLWRSQGSEAGGKKENPFQDVAADAYYAAAVMWAVENEITNGMSANSFAPDAFCTRAQIVTFLYRSQT